MASPDTATCAHEGTAGMSPGTSIPRGQGAGAAPQPHWGEEEKGNWFPQDLGLEGSCRSDPVPRVRPCSSHPGEFVAHPIRASHHLGFGKTPFLPLQAGAVSDPCCPGRAACEAPAGSVSWLCNHRQRFLIPPPAALRGFAEQIQSEVKFPLKSSGWEGKLRYWQQQQWC